MGSPSDGPSDDDGRRREDAMFAISLPRERAGKFSHAGLTVGGAILRQPLGGACGV
jgi:hypothetical protein